MSNTSAVFFALVHNEVRLRARRISSLVLLLAMTAVAWFMVLDPKSGMAMMVVHKARMAYESGTLAFGTATLGSAFMGIIGFYLSRGRSQEDLRQGCASVLAATPVGTPALLLSRWLGALLFLCGVVLAMMLTTWMLQVVRGVGPVQPWVYLQTYTLILLPVLMLSASLALLSDAWAPLMGKLGDLLYFLLWMAQFAVLPATVGSGRTTMSPWFAFDVMGLGACITRLVGLMHTDVVSVGGSNFDPALAVLHFPADFWTGEMIALRLASALLALLPLIPAVLLFHRYSPDKVKARSPDKRFFLLTLLQKYLQPLGHAAGRLLPLAAGIPGLPGRVLADALLSLMNSPLAIVLLVAAWLASVLAPAAALPGILMGAAAVWGILISDLAARDAQACISGMAAAMPGGAAQRFWRQYLASLLLGLLFCVPVALRSGLALELLSVLTGLSLLSAAASLLGLATRGRRSFLALFLGWLYVATQIRDVAWLDLVGFNGAAGVNVGLGSLAVAALLLALGAVLNRRELA